MREHSGLGGGECLGRRDERREDGQGPSLGNGFCSITFSAELLTSRAWFCCDVLVRLVGGEQIDEYK